MPKKSTRKTPTTDQLRAGCEAEAKTVMNASKPAAPDPERQLADVTRKIIDLMIDLEHFDRQRVIATVQTFFPSKITVKPSLNGMEAMP